VSSIVLINRLLCPAAEAHLGKPLMQGSIAGVEFQGLSELHLAAGKIPIGTSLVGRAGPPALARVGSSSKSL
jgi:hypothetical protein